MEVGSEAIRKGMRVPDLPEGMGSDDYEKYILRLNQHFAQKMAGMYDNVLKNKNLEVKDLAKGLNTKDQQAFLDLFGKELGDELKFTQQRVADEIEQIYQDAKALATIGVAHDSMDRLDKTRKDELKKLITENTPKETDVDKYFNMLQQQRPDLQRSDFRDLNEQVEKPNTYLDKIRKNIQNIDDFRQATMDAMSITQATNDDEETLVQRS